MFFLDVSTRDPDRALDYILSSIGVQEATEPHSLYSHYNERPEKIQILRELIILNPVICLTPLIMMTRSSFRTYFLLFFSRSARTIKYSLVLSFKEAQDSSSGLDNIRMKEDSEGV
jgi:hypothetical protein